MTRVETFGATEVSNSAPYSSVNLLDLCDTRNSDRRVNPVNFKYATADGAASNLNVVSETQQISVEERKWRNQPAEVQRFGRFDIYVIVRFYAQ